jgi:hypothetical protein
VFETDVANSERVAGLAISAATSPLLSRRQHAKGAAAKSSGLFCKLHKARDRDSAQASEESRH